MKKNLMKKRAALFAAGVLTTVGMLALAGCGGKAKDNAAENSETVSADAAAATGRLAQIKEAGKMTVAMEGTWAPWTYHDEDDKLVGFDVEVASAIAAKLGVEAEFVEGEWDGLLAGLQAGRYDIMVNGVDYTEERAEAFDFTDPYCYIRTAVIVNGDNTDINRFEDLNGKTTANTITSVYAQMAEEYGATTQPVDDLTQTLELLQQKRIDATLNAEVTFYDYMKEHPEADFKIAALTEDANNICIPLPKGSDSDDLREAINRAISELREEGVLSELSVKYFGNDITK